MKKLPALPQITAALAIASLSAAHAHDGAEHKAKEHGAKMNHAAHCGLPAGEGVINAFDPKKLKINLTHEPIKSIGWPEMTMDFSISKTVDLTAFGVGERVHFLLKPEKEKSYSIAAMCSLDVAEGMREACMAAMHDVAMKTAKDAGKSCEMGKDGSMKGMDHGNMNMQDETGGHDHEGHH